MVVKQKFFCLALFALICAGGLNARVLEAHGITVLGQEMPWNEAMLLEPEALKSHAIRFEAADPNFRSDGIQSYTGIPLESLLNLAGLSNTMGITVIGGDQYVGFLTPARVKQARLAWEMGGSPIPGVKGGPLKVIFDSPGQEHASCYTWYVDTIVQGRPAGTGLILDNRGKKTFHGFNDLVSRARPLDREMLSIAQGCRSGFTDALSSKTVMAVPLAGLMETDPAASQIEFIPYAGNAITLPARVLEFGAMIIVSCDDQPFHPALGGPYAITFPLEAHLKLQGMVPESGAFFFLKKIIAR